MSNLFDYACALAREQDAHLKAEKARREAEEEYDPEEPFTDLKPRMGMGRAG